MRSAIMVSGALVTVLLPAPARAEPPKSNIVLYSAYFSPGLSLPELKHPVYAVRLEAAANAKGEGKGVLILTVTPPNYDEYGDPVTGTEVDQKSRPPLAKELPPVRLECQIELEKRGFVGRVNQPSAARSLFRLTGPKFGSTLYIATPGPGLAAGRFLVYGKHDRAEYVVEMNAFDPNAKPRQGLPVPCHPGCFPAGTLVLVPGGSKRIEQVRVGDVVTTVGPDGRAGQGTVEKLYTTTNALVQVRTDTGTAVTTDAQPFSLTDGQFRRAGELKPGDRVWHWRDGKRAEAVVRAVVPTGRREAVYNLIVGDSATFVAGGFVVRGKPPADAAAPAAVPAAHRHE
ncbi:MAG TPA: Hint domain-containing protein [Gemmataceae bacterium]|jgi:hypothetical protein